MRILSRGETIPTCENGENNPTGEETREKELDKVFAVYTDFVVVERLKAALRGEKKNFGLRIPSSYQLKYFFPPKPKIKARGFTSILRVATDP